MKLARRPDYVLIRVAAIGGFLGVVLAGCTGDDLDRDHARLIRAAQQQVGSSPDVVLTKFNYGENDPIALVFGMANDMEFCLELADMYMGRYPNDTYVCLPAKGYQLPD